MKNKVIDFFTNLFGYVDKENYLFVIPEEEKNSNDDSISVLDENKNVYNTYSANLDYMKSLYNTMINSDIKVREFTLNARNKQYNSFIIYIDGMVDSKLINDFILNPLMLRNNSNLFDGNQQQVIYTPTSNNVSIKKVKKFNLTGYISNCLIPQNDVQKEQEFANIVNSINSGNCALFVDTIDYAFCIDVKGFKQRNIDKPSNELVIRGSQEAFTEVLRTNTSILRRLVNNENLIIENVKLGKISKTNCSICYVKNIANEDLISEVKYRINNLDIDYLISSGQLEQLISDNSRTALPQIISTERADRAVEALLDR